MQVSALETQEPRAIIPGVSYEEADWKKLLEDCIHIASELDI